MKTKALSVLAGVGAPLILAGAANAGFVGIKLVQKTIPPGIGVPAGAKCFNLFATFNRPPGPTGPVDMFLAGSGTPMAGGALNIAIVGGGNFYQNTVLGPSDKPPSAAAVNLFPSLAFDTFVTIGIKKVGTGGQPGPDALVLTPGWPGFGLSSLTGTNLGWAVTPSDAQANAYNPLYANGNGQVLIGQFTILTGTNVVVNNLHVLVRSNSTVTAVEFNVNTIPSPGALALLGTAGLVGTRRRRRV